ncbi:hypothetical protein PSTG_03877 [Puccinia striiformis f. sp. tritici PST-78]|uniref:Uncharacterized protein n=1 Tax=Puccinia striiformis f. sp. tritici PST-78 TaxID=1165861 RepID=A0A0L0VUH0_9BASI|nr:hypothetical protein PSTG_03877 [Puccinia striiformis f. sp. tritici PST-78]
MSMAHWKIETVQSFLLGPKSLWQSLRQGGTYIVDPKVEVIRKLASRITDALAADISNVGTNEDEAGA